MPLHQRRSAFPAIVRAKKATKLLAAVLAKHSCAQKDDRTGLSAGRGIHPRTGSRRSQRRSLRRRIPAQ